MEKQMLRSYCFECDKDVEYVVTKISGTFRVKDKNIKATIYEAHCATCGARMIVDEVERKNGHILFEAYKKEKGLMTAEQIKALREKYRLSAVAFAKILGLGAKNVTRYENGAIQSDSIDRYLKMAENEEAFWACYKEHRKELTSTERAKSDKAYDEYEQAATEKALDQLNAYLSWNENYTIQSHSLALHFKKMQKLSNPFKYCAEKFAYVPLIETSQIFRPISL